MDSVTYPCQCQTVFHTMPPGYMAGIPDKGYPLHHPKFQIDEDILPYSLEALYEILSGIDKDM